MVNLPDVPRDSHVRSQLPGSHLRGRFDPREVTPSEGESQSKASARHEQSQYDSTLTACAESDEDPLRG
jgi:hypothetical protein